MRATIKNSTGFLPLAKARLVAEALQASDPEWQYKVIDCQNGFGRIDIFDEDGELVESGFIPPK